MLISRNFCDNDERTVSAIYNVEIWINSPIEKNSSNQLCSDLFSKIVTFTKFCQKSAVGE